MELARIFIPLSFKLFLLFIVYAIRRTGQCGFPSSGFPTHRLIKDINIACKPHYYTPLCTTHLNSSCGHETNNFEIKPGHIDGNMFVHHLNHYITHLKLYSLFRYIYSMCTVCHLHARSNDSRAQWHG